jgi:hypothetical protein
MPGRFADHVTCGLLRSATASSAIPYPIGDVLEDPLAAEFDKVTI